MVPKSVSDILNDLFTANGLRVVSVGDPDSEPSQIEFDGKRAQATSDAAVYVELSTGNSSTAELAAAATFTGTIENCYNHGQVSVLVSSSQNGTVTLNGYQDLAGVRRVFTRSFPVRAGIGFNIAQNLNFNFFNLTFRNDGTATTVGLVIDTAYGIFEAQVQGGASPVSLQDFASVGAAASIAAINTDLLTGTVNGWLDVSGYRSASIHVIGGAGISAGQIIFEQTNDTSVATPPAWAVEESSSLTPTPQIAAITIAANTNRMFGGGITSRFIRVRASTGFVGGNVNAVAFLCQLPHSRMVQTVAQATAGNFLGTFNIASSQTLATVTTLTTLTGGAVAEDAATTSNPLIIGGVVRTALPPATIALGDAMRATFATNGALAVAPFCVPELAWNYVAPAGGTITNSTTAVTMLAAPAAGTRRYITSVTLNSDALSVATELVIRGAALTVPSATIASNTLVTSAAHGLAIGDAIVASASTVTGLTAGTTYYVLTVPSTTSLTLAATQGGTTLAISGAAVTATINHILWRKKLQTAGIPQPLDIRFGNPLRGGVAQPLEVVTLTAATGSIYLDAQGFTAF